MGKGLNHITTMKCSNRRAALPAAGFLKPDRAFLDSAFRPRRGWRSARRPRGEPGSWGHDFGARGGQLAGRQLGWAPGLVQLNAGMDTGSGMMSAGLGTGLGRDEWGVRQSRQRDGGRRRLRRLWACFSGPWARIRWPISSGTVGAWAARPASNSAMRCTTRFRRHRRHQLPRRLLRATPASTRRCAAHRLRRPRIWAEWGHSIELVDSTGRP